MTHEREQRRTTFDAIAGHYLQARPDYPDALYDELTRLADLRPDDRLLEIGCGPGKATIPLARRGFAITCVELGADLAAQARLNLAEFSAVEVINADFESWSEQSLAAGTARGSFSLVYAATAWHWVDPAVRYRRAWELLRAGGQLAFWGAWHVLPADGDPIFAELQKVYDELGESDRPGERPPLPEDLASQEGEIEHSGLFTEIRLRRFDWEIKYTAEEYISLLKTFSNHIAMPAASRERLFNAVRDGVADRPDGRLRRHWGAVLHVARRLPRD